jgi:hypothetical protein
VVKLINLIIGKRGTGKSKKIIDLANEAAEKVSGEIVFISLTNKHMFDLNYKIRYINTTELTEFQINTFDVFIGFIGGVISENFDITNIYIDGLLKIVKENIENAEIFFKKLDSISKKYNIDFIMTMTCEKDDIPNFMKEFAS